MRARLYEFLCKQSHRLPVKVTVKRCSLSPDQQPRPPIATGDTLSLHFLKHVHSAAILDPAAGEDDQADQRLWIPSNSSIKFGLIYNPSPDDVHATSYMQLKTAGDLMKLKQLPYVVMATADSPDRAVSEGEVLFLRGVTKGRKQLSVVNAEGKEKNLSAKCAGSFSTDPRHTRVCLSVLLSQQELPLQHYVILYPMDREVSRRLPPSMNNAAMLLDSVREEVSVVAPSSE